MFFSRLLPLATPPALPLVVIAATVVAAVVVVVVVDAAPAVATVVDSPFNAGGVCNNTYSLNITEGRRLADVGGLRKPEVHG